jgi:hypothetical protein
MNTDVADLLRESIDRLTDGERVPAGLADRAYERNRRRRIALGTATATGTAALAAAAVLVATSVTGGVPRGGSRPAQTITTAYVLSHTERALAALARANLIEVIHTTGQHVWFTPFEEGGNCFQLRCDAGRAQQAIYSSYRSFYREEGLSAKGPVYDYSVIPLPSGRHGQHEFQVTGDDYDRKVWWSGASRHGLRYEPNPYGQPGCPAAVGPPLANFPNWSAQVRHALACGSFRVAGRQRIGGIDTIKIVSVGPAWGNGKQTLWVNPATYLPVRATAIPPRKRLGVGVTLTGDFRWLPPTKANLATAFGVRVPRGFHRVPVPNLLIPGTAVISVPTRNQPLPTPQPSQGPLPLPSGVPSLAP